MNSSSKKRIKLLLIVVVFLLVLIGMVYVLWGSSSKTVGMYTSRVKIVNEDNLESINKYGKYTAPYAYKVKEKDKSFLNYTYCNNEKNITLTLTNEQYDDLVEGNYYWFNIKFSDPGNDHSEGTLRNIYTHNPVVR